ncbi:MAG TPA: SMP-30/gluconolactonase/LRE family protein [Fimbriimonadaceae bacterium]|nr:SMP-30/gluconolactonase/LRE family protein [Fimbriimonadaceae bacterium]
MCYALVALLTTIMGSDQPIIAPGATLHKISGGFRFTEGPATDRDGNVYFTDQPNDRIVRWSVDGTVEDWMKPCGRSNGMCFDKAGNLIACADEHNQLWSITPDKQVTVLIKDAGGKLLDGPNDVWIRPDGGMYLTDPLYARDYWTRDPAVQQTGEHVWFLSADHKTFRPVVTDFNKPNGIIGTPDGHTLYIADIGANKTWRYRIEADGSLTDKTLFCELGSDGMTIDNRGNVYLTGHGVTVFNSEGKQIEHIDVPENWTGNITFAGKDRTLLFMTASTSIYSMQMLVHGVGPRAGWYRG